MIGDDEAIARCKAQRDVVLEELKKLDTLYGEAGIFAERRTGDFLTRAVVLTSWHRAEPDSDQDSNQIHEYRLTDMPEWQVLGLCEATANACKHTLLVGNVDDEDDA